MPYHIAIPAVLSLDMTEAPQDAKVVKSVAFYAKDFLEIQVGVLWWWHWWLWCVFLTYIDSFFLKTVCFRIVILISLSLSHFVLLSLVSLSLSPRNTYCIYYDIKYYMLQIL